MSEQYERMVFICHASEDKELVAAPLATALRAQGVTVWYDDFELTPGDSLRTTIDRGLATSRFGIVILSHAFFGKAWANWELSGLHAREMAERHNVIIPIWHGVTSQDVRDYSPPISQLVALRTDRGIDVLVDAILRFLLEDGLPDLQPAVASSDRLPRPTTRTLWAPVAGFRVDDALMPDEHVGKQESGSKGPWLVAPEPLGVEMAATRWDPFESPDLHREFARLDTAFSEDSPYSSSILEYANGHGALGHGTALFDPGPITPDDASGDTAGISRDDGRGKQKLQWGESLDFWATEVRKLAALIAVWDLVRAGNATALERLVSWHATEDALAVYIDIAIDGTGDLVPEAIARAKSGEERPSQVMREMGVQYLSADLVAHSRISRGQRQLLEHWDQGDLVGPAEHWVVRKTNKVLGQHAGPILLRQQTGIQLTSLPECQRGALYTLLAQEISGMELQ